MRALLCARLGTPEDLEITDVPEPVPAPGEVVVDIAAAALNFLDTLIIAGKYQTRPPLPFSPAAEFAGIVAALGSGVTSPKIGQRVMGYVGWGAARERLAVAADKLVVVPDGLDFDRAAGLGIAYGTGFHALKDRAQLRVGETLAVLGASGGTGLAAVELGKAMGARVIACASSDRKLAFLREQGADAVVNYAKDDLKETLRRLTERHGVDVVYDPVGGGYTEAALRALAWQGRLLVVGFAAGEIPKLPLNLVLLKGCDIRGVFWGEWVRRESAAHRALLAELANMCAAGKISGHVHAVYPLEQAPAALKAIASREVMGKVILKP